MSMQTDVKGASCAANATTVAFANRTRVRAITISATTANATDEIKDNTFSLFTYTATVAGPVHILIPADGIVCQTNLTVVCAAGVSAVVFYG